MRFIEALKELEESKIFKDWKKENRESFLAHGFIMGENSDWQIGFFNPGTEKILTFVISDNISMNPESEIMKKKVDEIDISKIKVNMDEAFNITDDLQKEKYKQHPALKKFAILQNTDKNQIWNITYVTRTFKTINIQVDTESGKVISDQLVEIFRFDK